MTASTAENKDLVTRSVMCTAMCVSEYMADAPEGSAFNKFVEDFDLGAFELRDRLAKLGEAIELAFDQISEKKREDFTLKYLQAPCWDYQVVPWMCEKAAELDLIDTTPKQSEIIDWVEEALATLPKEESAK